MAGSVVAPGRVMEAVVHPPTAPVVRVVSVTHYQSSFEARMKKKRDTSGSNFLLVPYGGNKADPKAIQVHALSPGYEVDAYLIGFIEKSNARIYYDIFREHGVESIATSGYIGWWEDRSIYYAKIELFPPHELEKWIKSHE